MTNVRYKIVWTKQYTDRISQHSSSVTLLCLNERFLSCSSKLDAFLYTVDNGQLTRTGKREYVCAAVVELSFFDIVYFNLLP